MVPGKTRAGGQSAPRFQRIRELAKKDFFKKVASYMKEAFLNRENLKGIILGGPGPSKDELYENGYITGQVRDLIIAVKDVGYCGEFGLEELLANSGDVLMQEAVSEEKNIVNKLKEKLAKEPDKVVYGYNQIIEALKQGAVDTLLISEELEDEKIEEFEKLAEQFGTETKVISVDTNEGVFIKTLGKVAGFLRFPISNF
jgi:peptide chain release factor subunit 1